MTSDTKVSLPDFGADELLSLGGLKATCAAQVKCAAHGHHIPCELCQLEDKVSSFCSACNKAFDTPPLPGERACASLQQFMETGKVAFEDDALAALNARESQRKRKKKEQAPTVGEPATAPAPYNKQAPLADDKIGMAVTEDAGNGDTYIADIQERKTWEDFKRKHRLNYYAPVRRRPPSLPAAPEPSAGHELPDGTPREPVEREAPVSFSDPAPYSDPAPSAPSTPSVPSTPPAPKKPRRRREASAADTLPPSGMPSPASHDSHGRRDPSDDALALMSLWASLFTAIAGAYVWYHSPLADSANRSFWHLLSFWASTLFVWFIGTLSLQGKEPAHGTMSWWSPAVWACVAAPWPGLAAAILCKTGSPGQDWLDAGLAFVYGLAAAVFGIWAMLRCGTRLTMSPPWPVPMDDEGREVSGWYLAKIIATIVLNFYLWDIGSAMWRSAHTAAPPQSPPLSAPLESLVNTMNAVKQPARLKSGPEMDRLKQALSDIDNQKKPAAGNTAEARKLQKQAAPLYQKADWKGAYPLLRQAHDAAPGLEDIAVQLGATESAIGKSADAARHLGDALLINPRNPTAWRVLGDNTLRSDPGSEASVQRAADYYLLSWWFAKDRKQAMQAFERAAASDAATRTAVDKLKVRIRQ